MYRTRRILGAAAAIAVLATISACGDESSTPTTSTPNASTSSTPSTSTPATSDSGTDGSDSASGAVEVQLSEEFCAKVGEENPPSDLAASAPEELRDGTTAVVTFAEILSSSEPNPNAATELADTLGADGVADQIRDLAGAVEEQCEVGEAGTLLAQVATAATFASGESDQAYCDALRTEFADPSEQPSVGSLIDLAPSEQREALESLAANSGTGSGGPLSGNFGALLGLGLYAEARCDVPGAFGIMFLGAAFAGEAGSSSAPGGGN